MHKQHPATTVLIEQGNKQYETVVHFNNFTDGDTHCLIEDPTHVAKAKILIKHYLYPNQNEQIVRLLFLVNTLADLGAASIEVFVPYLPYARQDKAHLPGEAISSNLLCRLLSLSKVQALHTIDCHFMKGKAETTLEGLKIYNTLVQGMLIKKLESLTDKPYHIIGPDAGASYLANGETMKKARAANYVETKGGPIRRDVETLDDAHLVLNDDTLVIADDMVSTGSTMIKALESLKARGIPSLYAMTSHGLFLNGSLEKIQAATVDVIYSDTIPLDDSVPVVDTVFAAIARELL